MNYYELPEGFMRSAMVNMVTGRIVEWETLSKATKGFTDIQLTIQMNGIDIDAEPFLTSLGRRIEHAAKDKLNELVRNVGLTALAEAVNDIDQALKQELYARVNALGIELPEEDY